MLFGYFVKIIMYVSIVFFSSLCHWKAKIYACGSSCAYPLLFAPSRDYGIFRPPLTHISNAHAQPFSEARCLNFSRILCLLPYFMCPNNKGSGETAQARLSLHWSPLW